MVSKNIPEEALRNAATDVAYEFKMLREARRRYFAAVSPALPDPSLGSNNAAIPVPLTLSANATTPAELLSYLDRDALLIHLRVLIDFFFGKETQDDVRAHHYTGEAPRPYPAWYVEFREKCNKLFAHLTLDRTTRRLTARHEWYEIPTVATDMEAEISRFLISLKSLRPERLAWFGVGPAND